MHTTKQTTPLLRTKATIPLGGLSIDVEVLDVKMSYGRTRYQVQPLAGAGAIWVEQIRIKNESDLIQDGLNECGKRYLTA